MSEYVRDGDQLIVTRIDRLARSTLHLCQIAETLREKGVDLVVLDQNIDTSDATGRLLFNMLGAIGQFETEIRAERQMDGIKKAKDRGVQFGKRPALTEKQIIELRDKRASGALIKDLMADYRLSKATIYRYLSENET
jgi:DNA invertase Pin-like site-specific DNA recombinase